MRVALRVVQLGAVAVVVAVTTYFTFALDRFFIPKELVLHAAAVLAALAAMRTLVEATTTRVDRLLAGYVAAGAALTTATLVLTRSRAAWLAFAAVVVVFLVAMLGSPPLRRDARAWRRLIAILLFIGAGVGAALLLPNALHWRGKNPYLQSVKHVTDYESGSGR